MKYNYPVTGGAENLPRPNESPAAQPPLSGAAGSVAALRKELSDILEAAEMGIVSERLAGNIVKEEFWKGQRSVVMMVFGWLDAEPQNDQTEASAR